MAAKKFVIYGKVIDRNTQAGISSLKVEAWDKDEKYDDLIGVAFTGRDGSFIIKYDETYFREFARDVLPDLYFKVFRGEELLKSTKDSVIVNASQREDVVITLDLYHSLTEGIDRMTPDMASGAYSFIRQSDFKGLSKEAKNKTNNGLNFIKDMVTGSLKNLKPIKVSGVKDENIVGRDTKTAQANLSANNITVANVLPYDPKLNSDSLKQFTGYPVSLKSGQKVNLYEKDGKVQYYTVVKAQVSTQDIQSIKDELNTTKAQVSEKDKTIAALQKQVLTLKKEQDLIRTQVGTDSINNLKIELEAMKKQLANISPRTTKTNLTKTTKTRSSGKSSKGTTDIPQ